MGTQGSEREMEGEGGREGGRKGGREGETRHEGCTLRSKSRTDLALYLNRTGPVVWSGLQPILKILLVVFLRRSRALEYLRREESGGLHQQPRSASDRSVKASRVAGRVR